MSILTRDEWLASPVGCYLLEKEQALFDQAVGDLFGFNAVQLTLPQADMLRNSRIPFLCLADSMRGDVNCQPHQMPFLTGSIDLLVMPHGLDFSQNPHETLREAERVLVPEGHVVITGFNPLSSWGIKRSIRRRHGFPWYGSFLPMLRIKDWLALLGFEIVECRMTCYAPPFNNAKWLHRFNFLDRLGNLWWPMGGGVYFIVAKKRVVGMRLIKPGWKKPKLKSRLVATPTQKTDSKGNNE